MIYSIEKLKELVAPIAEKHKLRAVWVFGSYARGEATEESDVDFLIDMTDDTLNGFFAFGGLYNDFEKTVGKKLDLVTTSGIDSPNSRRRTPRFRDKIYRERVSLYEQQRH